MTHARTARHPAVALAATATAVALLAGSTSPAPASAAPRPTASTPSTTVAGSWESLPTSPVASVYSPVSVWTGKELITVGYTDRTGKKEGTAVSAGAAYNPTTRTWRTLPTPPDTLMAEGGYQAAWTGREMLVAGLLNAAYNPTTNTWRSISTKGSHGRGGAASAWTGTVFLFWGGGCCMDTTDTGGAYDPATDTWSDLPAAPLSSRFTSGVWTGTELYVLGGTGPDNWRGLVSAAAYNPTTRTWRKLPDLPAARNGETMTWTGSRLVVLGGTDDNDEPAGNIGLDAGATGWRELSSGEAGRRYHAAVPAPAAGATDSRIYVWGGKTRNGDNWVNPATGLVYFPATDTWQKLPTSPLRGRANPSGIWTGRSLIVWGGDDQTNGAVFTPR